MLNTSNIISEDIVNWQDNEKRLFEDLKPYSLIGYDESFHFCKEQSEVRNID